MARQDDGNPIGRDTSGPCELAETMAELQARYSRGEPVVEALSEVARSIGPAPEDSPAGDGPGRLRRAEAVRPHVTVGDLELSELAASGLSGFARAIAGSCLGTELDARVDQELTARLAEAVRLRDEKRGLHERASRLEREAELAEAMLRLLDALVPPRPGDACREGTGER